MVLNIIAENLLLSKELGCFFHALNRPLPSFLPFVLPIRLLPMRTLWEKRNRRSQPCSYTSVASRSISCTYNYILTVVNSPFSARQRFFLPCNIRVATIATWGGFDTDLDFSVKGISVFTSKTNPIVYKNLKYN